LSVYHLKISRLALAASIALLLGNLGFCALIWFAPKVSYAIPASQIQPEIGIAYSADLGSGEIRLYRPSTDTAASPSSSRLMLFEDGRALGPMHSLHADIRQKGSGRFSHWNGALIFSTTDGTDPRTNGRVYAIVAPTKLQPLLKYPLLAVLALADIGFLILFRQQIVFLLRRWGALFAAGLAASLVLLAALAAFGVLGTIVVAKDGLPADGGLVLQTLQHAVLGCLISIGIWAAGAGVTRLILRDPRSGLAPVLIPAFPVSMVLLAVLLALALVLPWGRTIAFTVWLACLLPLRNWRPPHEQIVAILNAATAIVPFGIAFGVWLGLLWHGPTDTLSGTPSGDVAFYAGNIWALADQAYPHFDLGYADSGSVGYFNQFYPALGAALLHLPNFDPFLFLLASGATSYVLLSALMVHLYVADRVSRPIGQLDLLLLTLCVVVAARYPYWVVESIPMVFVPALTIAVWWMAERGRHKHAWSVAAILAALSGSVLSKVVSAAVLVPLSTTGVWSSIGKLPSAAKLFLLMIAGVFGVYSAAMLLHFLPILATISALGPESFRTPRWFFVSRDMGAGMMMVLAWTIVDWSVALSLSLGVITFLAFSFMFQVNFVCVSIVLGLILISVRPMPILARMLGAVAFALSLPAAVLSDYAGASSGLPWIACIGGATVVAALTASGSSALKPEMTFRKMAAVAATTLTVTAFGLIGVARQSIIADSGWHFTQSQPLTPALKEIWSAVRERTPKDALIFTDQVDDTEYILGGWNTYAYSGQRQIYLSSYYTNLELRSDKQKLQQILATNKAVLEGIRPPQSVRVRRSYSSFYAVVSDGMAVPPDWRPVFRNDRYALYQIGVADARDDNERGHVHQTAALYVLDLECATAFYRAPARVGARFVGNAGSGE
jgi:hypothetical protein